MILSYAEWPKWLLVAAVAPLCFFVGALTIGWWPRNARGWRVFGFLVAAFTVFCVLMICVFSGA